MTSDAKRLLLVVGVLLFVQWFMLPVLTWQNERVDAIEISLQEIAARNALSDSLGRLEQERDFRSNALESLSGLSFTQSAKVTLEMQRTVSESLAEKQLLVEKFEWAPLAPGPLGVARARVSVRGRATSLLEWLAGLQFEPSLITVIAFKYRHAGGRAADADIYRGDLTLQFVLSDVADG
jgi:hypothetical protein